MIIITITHDNSPPQYYYNNPRAHMNEIQTTVLSNPVDINFFQKKEPRESKGFSLVKYLWGSDEQNDKKEGGVVDGDLRVLELFERFSVAYSQNRLELFSVEFIESKESIEYWPCQTLSFDQKIELIITNRKHSSPTVLMIMQMRGSIRLYRLDAKEKKLVMSSSYSLGNINAISFFGPNFVCAITNTNHFWELDCSNHKITKKVSLPFSTHPQPSSGKVIKGYITGSTESLKQQSSIYYLYISQKSNSDSPTQTIMIKEFKKKLGVFTQSKTFQIQDREIKKSRILSASTIFYYKNSFVICLEDEIVIIKKIFEEYVLLDNVRKRTEDSYMMCNEEGIFCFCENRIIEVCQIVIQDNSCVLENVNIVECGVLERYSLWKVVAQQSNLFFYFKLKGEGDDDKELEVGEGFNQDEKEAKEESHQRQRNSLKPIKDQSIIKLSCLVKQNSMKKLVSLSKNGVHPKMFYRLSSRLGISKKDFFLEQWHQSQKNLYDINTFLFQTQDVSTIKHQLKMSYHKHAFHLTQHVSIYNKLFKMIQHQLTLGISKKLIKQYCKCHFLLRKLKIEYNKTLEYKEFMEISTRGVIEYLQKLYLDYWEASHLNTKQKQKEGKTVKFQLIIKNILSEYHVIFLENYESDLIEIIKPFKLNLQYFFEKFPFFLPQYPYNFEFIYRASEKPQHYPPQPKLYSSIKESHWEQQLNLEQLRKLLEKYHPTSLVTQKLNEMITHPSFKKTRLIKHGLILSNIKEYIDKANNLSSIKLFLRICQFNNMSEKGESSLKLLQIFSEKNNLKGEALMTCQFYAQLHRIVYSHEISDVGIDALSKMATSDVFALFFLGNRQKTSLVFDQLKPLYEEYSKVIESPYKCSFSTALAAFIYSDICSPIEVKQLLIQMVSKGHQFQNANQEIISILIDGYCYRTEIRETQKMKDLIKECLTNMMLTQELNERVMRISTIVSMYDQIQILPKFRCDTQSVLNIEKKGIQILKSILESFFENKIIDFVISFDNQNIEINNPRNMLNVLLYISEKLYATISVYEILVMYGICLIDYECFDVLNTMIWEEEVLELLEIDKDCYCQDLISHTLGEIYRDESIESFEEVRSHIRNILDLFPYDYEEQSDYLRKENARYEIGSLISSVGFEVSPSELYNIESKETFVEELIENGYQNIDLLTIRKLNSCLKRLHGEREDQEDGNFLTWVALLSKMLIKTYSPRAMESVRFLIDKDCFYQLYNLFTEAMLQCVGRMYPEESEQSRRIIEHYVFNYHNYPQITNMFRCNFSVEAIFETSQEEESFKKSVETEIEIHESLFYLHLEPEPEKLEDIQRIARKFSKTTLDFYRYYYFLTTVLSSPSRGNSICEIEYDYQTLWQIVDSLGSFLLKKRQVHQRIGAQFNNYLLQKSLFIGLCQQGCNLINIPSFPPQTFQAVTNQNQYSILFTELKEKNHLGLLRVIKKCLIYLQRNEETNKIKVKKVEAYKRSMQKNIEAITLDDRLRQEEFKANAKSLANQFRLNKTMTYGEFKNDYLNYSQTHPAFTNQQILDLIWVDKVQSPRTIQHKRDSNFCPLSPTDMEFYNSFPSFKNDQYFFQLFESGSREKILQLREFQLMPMLRKYYSRVKISQFIRLLSTLKISDSRNIKMVQSAMRLQFQLDFKQIFDFDFFFYSPNQDQKESREYFECIFEHIKPRLKSIINENNWYISKIVYTFFKFEKVYEYRTILLALQNYLAQCDEGGSLSSGKVSSIGETIYPMLEKLSLGFIAANFDEVLGMCRGKELEGVVLECLNQIFERYEGGGKEKLREEEIGEIERVRGIIRIMMG